MQRCKACAARRCAPEELLERRDVNALPAANVHRLQLRQRKLLRPGTPPTYRNSPRGSSSRLAAVAEEFALPVLTFLGITWGA